MNHDYAHCADYDSNCPKSCFRAALTEDLKNYHYPVSFMNLKGTEECPLFSTNRTDSAIGGEKRTNGDRIRAMTDEELAKLLTDVAQKSADKLCESLKTVEVDLSNCNFHILYEAHLDWLKQEVKGEE